MNYYHKYKKYQAKLHKYLSHTGGVRYAGTGQINQAVNWYLDNSIHCSMLGTAVDNNLLILIEIPSEQVLPTTQEIGCFQDQRRSDNHGKRVNKLVVKLSIFGAVGSDEQTPPCPSQSYAEIGTWCREAYIQQELYRESHRQGDAICPSIITALLKYNVDGGAYLDKLGSRFTDGERPERLSGLQQCLNTIPDTSLGIIVMEYIDHSKTLSDIILDTDSYSLPYVVDCIVDAVYKLTVLNYNFGIQHNDFHLRNILINTETHHAYLIDFSASTTTPSSIYNNTPFNIETARDYWVLMDPSEDGHMSWTLHRSGRTPQDIDHIFEAVLPLAKTKYRNSGWQLFVLDGTNPDMSILRRNLHQINQVTTRATIQGNIDLFQEMVAGIHQ